jgi:hypothetical protein
VTENAVGVARLVPRGCAADTTAANNAPRAEALGYSRISPTFVGLLRAIHEERVPGAFWRRPSKEGLELE